MAKTASITVKFSVTGDGVTFSDTLPTLTNASSPFKHETIALASGANTITPPTGASFVVLVPPTTSAVTLTLKGVTGDTGLALAPAQPQALSLAGLATFVLTAGATSSIEAWWL